MLPFSILVESGYMGYELLLSVTFHAGWFNKFQDQSSAKGLRRQWVEFQKVRAWRKLTTKISIFVDKQYLYFFPDRKSTKCWTNSYALERNSVQKMLGFVMTGVEKENLARNLYYLLSTGNFATQCDFRRATILPLTKTPKPE